MSHYSEMTSNIKVSVVPVFLADQSNPLENLYVWAYTITIENLGQDTVQLISRHWKIIDSDGHLNEVIGEGVIGQQPILEQGEQFSYTSGCPLNTPSGFMSGTYLMRINDSDLTEVVIPAFCLDIPNSPRSIN